MSVSSRQEVTCYKVTLPPHLIATETNNLLVGKYELSRQLAVEVRDFLGDAEWHALLKGKDELSQRSIVKAKFTAVMEMIKEELKECKAWRMVLLEF